MPTDKKRKVCVVLVDRANYGRLKPVLRSIAERPELELQLVAAGTMVLERFGQPVQNVRKDGFTVDGEIYIELEGSTPATMAKSLGFAVMEFASEFQRLKPDVVMLIGDRYEALAAAIAAAYMNICIVHIQGGEVSGSIDESARHAITKLAHFHFPSTQRSATYLVRMGESPDSILGVGCPSSDIARMLVPTITSDVINRTGSGALIDLERTVPAGGFPSNDNRIRRRAQADGRDPRGAGKATDADCNALAKHRRWRGSHQQIDPAVPRSGGSELAAHDHESHTGTISRSAGAHVLRDWKLEQLRARRRLLWHAGGSCGRQAGRPRDGRTRDARGARFRANRDRYPEAASAWGLCGEHSLWRRQRFGADCRRTREPRALYSKEASLHL